MYKIAVFDDHAERREALALLLSMESDMECIGAYENCEGLVESFKINTPHVALMDIDMPGVDGIEGTKLICTNFPDVLVIMQTVFEDDEKIFQSIQAGAHGYILKKDSSEKILNGIREVINGGAPITPSIAMKILENFKSQNKVASPKEQFNLTKRELEILGLIVKGYSYKMVAGELAISTFTVNNHVKGIYRKLHVHCATEAVALALNRNLIKGFD